MAQGRVAGGCKGLRAKRRASPRPCIKSEPNLAGGGHHRVDERTRVDGVQSDLCLLWGAAADCRCAPCRSPPHVEVAFYSREWIRKEVKAVRPLAGCFSAARQSGRYNVTEALHGKKTTVVHAGMPLRLGMDCYDFVCILFALSIPTERHTL